MHIALFWKVPKKPAITARITAITAYNCNYSSATTTAALLRPYLSHILPTYLPTSQLITLLFHLYMLLTKRNEMEQNSKKSTYSEEYKALQSFFGTLRTLHTLHTHTLYAGYPFHKIICSNIIMREYYRAVRSSGERKNLIIYVKFGINIT